MAEQWMMCEVNLDWVIMFTPKIFERVSVKEFVKRHQNQIIGSDGDYTATICLLLSDGWEPYSEYTYSSLTSFVLLCFRKKYQG